MTQLKINQIPAHIVSIILSKQGPEDLATCYRTCKFFYKTIKQDVGLTKKLYIYYFGQKQLENVLATKQEKFSIHDELLKEFYLFGKLSKGDIQIKRLDIKLSFQQYRNRQRRMDQSQQPRKYFFESVNVNQVCFQGYRIGALIRVRQGQLEIIYLAIFDTLVGHLIAKPMKIKQYVYKQSLSRPDSMSLAFKQNMAIVRYNRDFSKNGRNNSDTHTMGQLLLLQTFVIEQIYSAKGSGQEHGKVQQQHDNSNKAKSAKMIKQPCFLQGTQTFQLQLRLQQSIRTADLTNILQKYINKSVIEDVSFECRQNIKQRLESLPYQCIELQDSVLQDNIFGTLRDHDIFLLVTFDGYFNIYIDKNLMGTFMAKINLRTGLIEMIHTSMSNLQVHRQLLELVKDTCENAKQLLDCLYKDRVIQLSGKQILILYDRFVTMQYRFKSQDGETESDVLEYVDLFDIRQSHTMSMNEFKGVIRDIGRFYKRFYEFYGSTIDMEAKKNDNEEINHKILRMDLKHCFDGVSEHEAQGQAFDTNQHIIFQGDRLLAQETKSWPLNLNHAVILPQYKDNSYQSIQYEEHITYPKISESKPPTSIMKQQIPLRLDDYQRITKSQFFLVDKNYCIENYIRPYMIYFGASRFMYRSLYPYNKKAQRCYNIVQAGYSNKVFPYIMAVDDNPISNNEANYNSESSISNKKSIGGKGQHSIDENKDQNVSIDVIKTSVGSKEQKNLSISTLYNINSNNVESDANSSDVCNYQNVNCNNDNIRNQQDDQYVSGCQRHSIDTNDNYPIQYVYGDTKYRWTDEYEENTLYPGCRLKEGRIDTYLSSFKLNPLKPYKDDHAKQYHISQNGQLKVFSEYIKPNLLQIDVSSCNRTQAQNLRDIHHAQETFQLHYENKPKDIQKECILHNTLSFQPYGFVLASCAYYKSIEQCNYDIFVIN